MARVRVQLGEGAEPVREREGGAADVPHAGGGQGEDRRVPLGAVAVG